jgi:hypothetical protein
MQPIALYLDPAVRLDKGTHTAADAALTTLTSNDCHISVRFGSDRS